MQRHPLMRQRQRGAQETEIQRQGRKEAMEKIEIETREMSRRYQEEINRRMDEHRDSLEKKAQDQAEKRAADQERYESLKA